MFVCSFLLVSLLPPTFSIVTSRYAAFSDFLLNSGMVQQELIRTVDLGPFKHIVDDGLELRKAAFECVDTLLDSCLDQVNPSSFIVPYLKSGLDGK